MARKVPMSVVRSTSTVGLPRESRTSRETMFWMVDPPPDMRRGEMFERAVDTSDAVRKPALPAGPRRPTAGRAQRPVAKVARKSTARSIFLVLVEKASG